MSWTVIFFGIAAIALTGHFIHKRRQRAAFVANLTPAERERLKGFESVKGDWREFRELLHR